MTQKKNFKFSLHVFLLNMLIEEATLQSTSKCHPITGHEATEGENKYSSTFSLASALYETGGV
jgi:hypothetical protein